MKIVLLFLVIIPMGLFAQEKGTHFEHGLSWAQVKEKAKAERKSILMDCYTTWCGPCKYLRDSIFPREEVGNALNDKFVCVSVQMDSTKDDDEDVRAWYADARSIDRDHKVTAYPTIYFFSPEGELMHRVVGVDEKQFLQQCVDALDPKLQYYTILRMVQRKEIKDTAFLRQQAREAFIAHDLEAATLFGTAYLDMQEDLLTDNSLRMIGLAVNHTNSKYFPLLLQNTARIDKTLRPGFSADKMRDIIVSDEILPQVFGMPLPPDWHRIKAGAMAKFPAYGEEAVAWYQWQYYAIRHEWVSFVKALQAYLVKYSDRMKDESLNSYAWAIFKNCSDLNANKAALEWAKKAVTHQDKDPYYVDTYANLLYKTGNTAEAIRWEEKASGMENAPFVVKETLERMKRGEKIWED